MTTDFISQVLNLVLENGYFILFILMFIEGPIIAFAASFASALGFFNPWIIFVLFIIGNQVPDVIIYYIARSLRVKRVEKFISYFGLNKKRIKWLEKNVKTHFIKTTIIAKTVPPFPVPGIILSGFMKVPFKRFFWVYLAFNIIYAVVFVALGYYAGLAANLSLKYFKLGELLLPIAVVLVTGLYILFKKISSKASRVFKDKDGF
jgi:membrane protein DedA with SNARE-associated domain